MSILVIAATLMEIEPFLAKKSNINYLITGVGSATAVYQLTKAVNKEKYSLVVQVGLAGTFNEKQLLGEAVIVKSDCFADTGVSEKNSFKNIFEMGLADSDIFPFKDGLLINNGIDQLMHQQHKVVKGITVNMISDQPDFIDQLQTKYEADIESMEGAALHYVCQNEQLPFLQIRGVSNQVGDRNKSNWKIKEAIESSNGLLLEIIHLYRQKNLL